MVQILHEYGIWQALEPYRPVLAGTFPIGLAIPGSDLDVICEVYDLEEFATLLERSFRHLPDFSLRRTEKQGRPTVVANFTAGGVPVEVFGQPLPAEQQNAVVHMRIEARLLHLAGSKALEAIRALKLQGLKTEPAFASYFGLQGDPYQTLLELARASDDELRVLVARRGSSQT